MNTLGVLFSVLIFAYLPAPTVLYTQGGTPVATLPQSYFVAVMEQGAEYTYVNYYDIDGYVKTADIEFVDYEPVTKYETTVRFKANNDGQPVNLRSAPDHTKNNIVRALAADSEGYCYGGIEGTALITQVGSLWYYVRTGPDNVRGYVYSGHIIVDDTPPNVIEKVTPSPPSNTSDDSAGGNPANVLTQTRTIIFIAALTVPAAFIMYLMFKKPRDNTKVT